MTAEIEGVNSAKKCVTSSSHTDCSQAVPIQQQEIRSAGLTESTDVQFLVLIPDASPDTERRRPTVAQEALLAATGQSRLTQAIQAIRRGGASGDDARNG